MFADGSNLFYSNEEINTLSKAANEELKEINEWFKKINFLLMQVKQNIYILINSKIVKQFTKITQVSFK